MVELSVGICWGVPNGEGMHAEADLQVPGHVEFTCDRGGDEFGGYVAVLGVRPQIFNGFSVGFLFFLNGLERRPSALTSEDVDGIPATFLRFAHPIQPGDVLRIVAEIPSMGLPN